MKGIVEWATDIGFVLFFDPIVLCAAASLFVLLIAMDEPLLPLCFTVLFTPVAGALIILALRHWGLA